jgi:hypothetical protein
MSRRVILCLAAVAGLFAGQAEAGQSSARFSVGIVIGGVPDRKPPAVTGRQRSYTWNAAAISVRVAGFESPVRLNRGGNVYWFLASRGGQSFRVAVSATTGKILRINSV